MNVLAVVISVAVAHSPLSSLVLEAETGPAYVVQNDNRYGPSGTKYSARDVGQQRNLFIGKRIAVEAGFGERHTAILLYAPLDLTTRSTLPLDINFRDSVFAAGTVVDHRYLFDGYRGSYLFSAMQTNRVRWDIGASVQIRNASVELRSVDDSRGELPGSRFAVEHDIGVVGALKTRLTVDLFENAWLQLDADAFSTFGLVGDVRGAIYDVAMTAGARVASGADVFVRMRWYGGGATVPDRHIENWGNFFFTTAGLRADLVDLF